MIFPIEVVLKGRDFAVTESANIDHGEASTWDDRAARDVLVEILSAIDRVQNPETAAGRTVILQGFSWIVEPHDKGGVVIAIEIPMGAAVAGPFKIDQGVLDAMITRVVRAERQFLAPSTIH